LSTALDQEKKKKLLMSPRKIRAPCAEEEQPANQVTISGFPRACDIQDPMKLLIFNVHGTLLDCSLLFDPNPNSKIKPTLQTRTRRVTIRPWLPKFLAKCFVNFRVAFWGSKSKGYMDEVIPAMLGRVKCKEPVVPAFVWSMAECEQIQWWNNDPVAWGCPLEIVFRKWPQWNLSNIVIIDYNSLCVNCNPRANVIIPTPFYLAQLTKLGEDEQFLKTSMWPQLAGLFGAADMEDFETHFPELRILTPKIPELENHDHENISNVVHSVAGEGTCGPFGSTCEVSPHLP
jgi:hypothetical protein